jgi:glycosyltransferase involved in cell wall biosynthesis
LSTPPIRHLGFNAVFLQSRMGGLETYVRRLIPALLEVRPSLRVSVFVNEAGRGLLAAEPWASSVGLVTHPLLGRRYTRALTETTLLGWLASRTSLDVLHSAALTAPLRTRALNVLTIADVTWLRQPDPAEKLTTLLWRTMVPPVARRADRIIVLSEATRREVVEDLRVAEDRIDVVPLGPGIEPSAQPTPERQLRERLELGPGPIVLAVVSTLKIHKNVSALVEAMAFVRQSIREAVAVVPANPTPLKGELERLAERIGARVVFPGWVEGDDLEGLYRAASCFVLPSLREGFGLPVLEAMRRGVPVACSNTSAMPEVAGDAALTFDPGRPDEIAAAVSRLLRDRTLAADLAERGRRRAGLFSWRRAAEQTLASYERALRA